MMVSEYTTGRVPCKYGSRIRKTTHGNPEIGKGRSFEVNPKVWTKKN